MDAADAPIMHLIGYGDAGVIDRIESEGIATEFFFFVLPVWPRKSYYIYLNRDGDVCQFVVPRNRRSVMLGYLRTPLWMSVAILGLPGIIHFERWKHVLAIAVALAVIATVLTFVAGKLQPGERERRALLKRVSGLGAPPELMPESMLEGLRDDIAEEWFHQHQTDWRDSIYRGVASETLVALAEYHRAPQLLIRARTNLIRAEGN